MRLVTLHMMHLLLALAALQAPFTIHGTVRDQTGLPISRALVFVDGTQTSVETTAAGLFTLAVDPDHPSTVIAFVDGFLQASATVDPTQPTEDIVLVLAPARVAEVVTVTGSRPQPPTSTFAMRPLDVVRTPGSQADLMRALQMLPGVGHADEGAGLYVRGGDTSEVLVLLDDAIIFHPYRQETPDGGYYGRVEPFLLEGLSFSTGGFSAKYGNALSAVLDLHGLERPETPHASVTVGLAGASASAAQPMGDRGGVRVSANRSFPGLLFAVNGEPYAFDPAPGGWDVNASAHYTSPVAGTVKVFAMTTRDHVGVTIDSLSFEGVLTSATASSLATVHWAKLLDHRWLTTATAALTEYTRGVGAGVLHLDTTDTRGSWRATTERAVAAWTLRLGADGLVAHTRIDGPVPLHGGDFGGVAGISSLRVRYGDRVGGAFAETERTWDRASARAGARVDRFDRSADTTVDPRLSASLLLSASQRLSAAWGVYHQAPDAAYFGYVTPAGLATQRAQHVVAGYEVGRETDPIHIRIEAYRKTYRNLPFESSPGVFTSTGYGSAQGVDVFAHARRAHVDLTATYSYLDAARRWTPFEDRGKYSHVPDGTWSPAFAMPHSAHVMARIDLTRRWQTAAGWHISSGRLDTPVIGTETTPAGTVPMFGSVNSERLPRYDRLDLTVTYLTRTIRSTSVILFGAVGNATAHTNFFQYAYSADYSTRRPVTSATPRVVYFGATLTR